MSCSIDLGARRIGAGQPCFLAAEIGINHNGDPALAHRMLEAAARAGADGVKFQNYRVEDFLGGRSLVHSYRQNGREVQESQWELFERCQLAPEILRELCAHARELGLVFFSTPTGADGVLELERLGAPLLKNGSDFLTHLPLVRRMAKSGIPTVLSTGMATLAEIDEAVRAFRGAGGRELLLLHCTSSYPTPPEDVHLRKLAGLSAAFDCPVGLSDHSAGCLAALGAVALGACMLEKHFTLDRALAGPDQAFSSDPEEFANLVRSVRELERCLGSARIGPTASEEYGRRAFRLSCVARAALPAGRVLREEDLVFQRPGSGLPPAAASWIVGRRLGAAVPAGKVFAPEDFA